MTARSEIAPYPLKSKSTKMNPFTFVLFAFFAVKSRVLCGLVFPKLRAARAATFIAIRTQPAIAEFDRTETAADVADERFVDFDRFGFVGFGIHFRRSPELRN